MYGTTSSSAISAPSGGAPRGDGRSWRGGSARTLVSDGAPHCADCPSLKRVRAVLDLRLGRRAARKATASKASTPDAS